MSCCSECQHKCVLKEKSSLLTTLECIKVKVATATQSLNYYSQLLMITADQAVRSAL